MLAPLSPIGTAALSDVICSKAEYRSWRAELPLSAARITLRCNSAPGNSLYENCS